MACCVLAVWITRLLGRAIRWLGGAAARLVSRRPAEREPAVARPVAAER